VAIFNPQASEYTFISVTSGKANLLAFLDDPAIKLSANDVQRTEDTTVINGVVYQIFKDLTPEALHFPVNLNTPTMQAAPPQGTSWLGLFIDWIFARGERDRQFGPDEPITQELRTSPGIERVRADYCAKVAAGARPVHTDAVRWGSGLATGDDDGLLKTTNMTRQFVGSFSLTIEGESDGSALFTAHNVTGFHSFLYHLAPDMKRGEGPPMMLNQSQTFWWTEPSPCHPSIGPG
jgi:hypothetical protein